MNASAKLQMVQIVLRWAWDPIGVRDIPEAADEYYSYAPAVLDMLEARASDPSIAEYLTSIVRDRMELRPNPKADEDVAELLREVYAVEA